MRKTTASIGRRFGRQVVTGAIDATTVEIQCDCGTIKRTRLQYLLSGESRSCGCGRYADLPGTVPINVGDVFERLTVVQKLGTDGRKRQVLARCSCGRHKVVLEGDLRSGSAKSCGCYRQDRMRDFNRKHGEGGRNRTPLYQAWLSMRERCSKPERWPSYVGITVFPTWQDSFSSFRDYITVHLGARPPGHSLDRIDNAKNYEPGNLRWATPREQSNNRWNTTKIAINGVTRSISDWARLNDITIACIRARLKYGWPEDLAVTTPGRLYKKRPESKL
jgi:hypothetical protein